MKDLELLRQKICPDCGIVINHYFGEETKPWCKKCDTYFTILGSWVIRNTNALQEYNKLFSGNIKKEG